MAKLTSRLLPLLLFLSCVGLLAFGFHSVLQGNSLGADFYTAWKAARAEFIEGRSPYDPAVALEIQMDIQGRPSRPDEDQFAYSYPIFGLLLVAPLAFLTFDWAQSIWMASNFTLVLVAGLALWPAKRRWAGASLWLFYPVSFALILGNFDLLLAVIWLAFFAKIIRQDPTRTADSAAWGALLAITTMKPQFSWFFILFTLFWVLSRKTWRLAAGFIAGCCLLWLLPFIWHAGWLSEWLRQIRLYLGTVAGHSSPLSHLFSLLPFGLAQFLKWSGAFGLLAASAFLFRQTWRGRISLLNLLSWCGIVTFLVHPTGFSYEQMTFLIPFFLWVLYERRGVLAGLTWVGAIVLSWLSLAATLSRLDPLADSSWLLAAAVIWLGWLFFQRRSDAFVRV